MRNKYLSLIFGPMLIILILSFGLTRVYLTKINDLNNELKYQAEIIAAGINPLRFKSLSDTPADKINPDYLRLREQLTKFGEITKSKNVRWLYTLTKKGNNYIFQVDSVAEGVFGHAEPGDVYQKPPIDFANAFAEKKIIITKPYSDEYGQFISCLIPIKDFNTGEMVSLLGLDVNYSDFQKAALRGLIYPVIVGTVVIILYILINIYLFQKAEAEKSARDNEEKYRLIAETAEKTKDNLSAKSVILEKLNKVMVGRELKMIELKKQLKQYEDQK